MSRRRKVVLASVLALSAVGVTMALWSSSSGPSYAGKNVTEWFEDYCQVTSLPPVLVLANHSQLTPKAEAVRAFYAMGTNSVPFLVSRVNRNMTQSRYEYWRGKVQRRFQPRSKVADAYVAAVILREVVKPPKDMLRPLLEPALVSTNRHQVNAALSALDAAYRVSPTNQVVSRSRPRATNQEHILVIGPNF